MGFTELYVDLGFWGEGGVGLWGIALPRLKVFGLSLGVTSTSVDRHIKLCTSSIPTLKP